MIFLLFDRQRQVSVADSFLSDKFFANLRLRIRSIACVIPSSRACPSIPWHVQASGKDGIG